MSPRASNAIMHGGAENSFFLDRLKEKTSQNVALAREIAKHADDIAEATRQIAAGSARARDVAARSRCESERGRVEINKGLVMLQHARQRAADTAADMQALREQSAHIQSIADVIGEIARQTHLLSLNASIESAQAGEYGKGWEPLLQAQAHPEVAFACAMDDHCYIGTHNRAFAQPLTGDYAEDVRHSRSKRFFNDRTARSAAANRKPYLLHTYKRDTGETMYDISSPIVVHGRHWGLFRIGYRPPG